MDIKFYGEVKLYFEVKVNEFFLKKYLQRGFSNTVKLSYNEHSVITNEYFGPKSPFSTLIDLVITNPGYNERIWPVPSCLL